MSLNDTIRERVRFVGGKVAGMRCPECGSERRTTSIDTHTVADVTCPECDATILTEEQKAQLRNAHKL